MARALDAGERVEVPAGVNGGTFLQLRHLILMTTHTVTDRCYWTDIAQDVDLGSEPLRGDIDVDVAIIGGGIVGVVAARLMPASKKAPSLG